MNQKMRYMNWFNRENSCLKALFKAIIVLMVFSFSIVLTKAQEYIPITYNHFDSVSGLYDEFGGKINSVE